MLKNTKKILCLVMALLMAATIFPLTVFASAADNSYVSLNESDALYTEGTKIYNRRGEEVFLRGINLGGWLIQEDWFTPVDNGSRGDLYSMRILESRFGKEKTYELYNLFQDNWMVETDFKNIADMGFNCVRIPFWYRNFQSDENGTWILDENGNIDLSRLEWAVEMCRKYGIYAILDLHAVNGVQGYADHAGLTKSYHFFDRNAKGEWYREQAALLWEVIAERFAGDPAIAMFDLLNEPMCNTSLTERIHSYYWEFYDMAYQKIRAKDPTRLMSMIGSWSVDKLPNPIRYGWTGVIYQFHQYDKNEVNYTGRIQSGWNCNYNVPLYAGEFHPVGDKVTLDFAIGAYDSNNVHWSLWTYKGYNSWAAWADWFAYGSTSDELKVDLENDSFDTIAYKWGEKMQTNSGVFKSGHLYGVAKKYLPGATLESVPFNTEDDVNTATFTTVEYTGEMHGPSDYKLTFGQKILMFIYKILDFFKSIIGIK